MKLNIAKEYIEDPFSPIKPEPLEVSYFSKTGFLVEFIHNNSKKQFCISINEKKITFICSVIEKKKLSLDPKVPLSSSYGVLLSK